MADFLRPIHGGPAGVCAPAILVVRRAGAAQQPDRAAPHTGVPEIGAALSHCYADAAESAQVQLEYRKLYIEGRLTDGDGRNHAECVAFVCQIGLWSLFHLRY